MEKPFICDSAIALEWEGFIYFYPKNDENNILAARFDIDDPKNPPLFLAGKELDGRLRLENITFSKQLDTATPSRVKQDDASVEESNTEVTGTVVDVNLKEHKALIRVERFSIEITVFDKCVEYLDVGAHVMLVGDLIFYYEASAQ